jgi:subtilisin family serine protease
VLIKFAPGASAADIQSIRSDLGATQLTRFASIGATRERIANYSVEVAIQRYRSDHRVAFIEPNYIYKADRIPNDTFFPQLWGMLNTGQTGGTPGADIRATHAWDITTGASPVLVAIIDTGMDYTHPDLSANVWTNPGEIPGNGIDDDGNGYVDDVHGYDFVNGDGDPMDDNGHGTHVSGTIGAVGDNGIGVAGVCWSVRIMALKFLDSGGYGNTSDAILAVQYATQKGARVMNNSWGGGAYSEALRLAIQAASDSGIVFVAAAGNDGVDNDIYPHYPASYEVPLVVAVASTDANDQLSYFSCYGATSVDLAAPGSDILSTTPNNTYSVYSGTSMATPHVTGALALMLSYHPSMTGTGAKQMLLNSVDPESALAGKVLTGGRLNVFSMLAEPDSTPPAAIADLGVTSTGGSWAMLAWTATGDDGTTGHASRYDLRYSTAPITEENFAAASVAPGPPNPQTAGAPETVQVSGLAFQTPYWFAIKAVDEFGNAGAISNVATGTTLGAPHIVLSPDSLAADLYTGSSATRTLNLSNTGLSELDFSVRTESGEAVAVMPAGQRLIASGHSVPLDQLERAGIRTRVQLEDGAALDRGAARRPAASKALQSLHVAGTDVFGSMQNGYYAGPRTRGNIFHCTTPSHLLEQRLYLEPSAPTQLWFLVYEGLAASGTYRVISASNASPAGPGAGWYSSGPLDVQLEANRYYVIVTSFEQACVYYNQTDVSPYPYPASFGELIAGAGWDWAPTSVFPPDTTQEVPSYAFGSPVAYYQTLVTRPGPRWLTAAPTQGVVPSGGAVDLTVTFDATGMFGGQYFGNVVVQNNDPVQPVASVPAHLHVTGAPDIALSPGALAFDTLFVGSVRTDTLQVANVGTDLLSVTGLTATPPQFTVEPASFQLAPGQSQAVLVHFAPTQPVAVAGNLAVASDDPDEPLLNVPLSGVGILPPDITVSPDSLTADLLSGEQTLRTLRVANDGASNLIYHVTLEAEGALATAARVTRRFAGPLNPGPGSVADRGSQRLYQAGTQPLRPALIAAKSAKVDTTPASGLRILLVTSNSTAYEIHSLLAAMPDVAVVDEFDAYTGVPTLDLLRQYNAVLLITSYAPADPTGLGDVLADYVDGGGSVIMTIASFINGWAVQGRFLTGGYYPFTLGSGPIGGSSLGAYDPLHPIMQGVTALTGDLLGSTAVAPGAQWVASYADSLPLVATQGHHVVGVNVYLGYPGYWTGDVPLLLHNAIKWAAGVPWLSVTPSAGVLPAGTSVDLSVTFDAAGLYGGDYRARLSVASNDPDEPVVAVPAHLHVTGVPDIAVVPASLDFGSLYIGLARTESLTVSNRGTSLLTVSGVTVAPSAYSVAAGGFSLAPRESRLVYVTFTPTSPTTVTGSLEFHSDDPDSATLTVPLTGTGETPPDIRVTPDSLHADLLSGDRTTRTIDVSNLGGADLRFMVSVRAATGPEPVAAAARNASRLQALPGARQDGTGLKRPAGPSGLQPLLGKRLARLASGSVVFYDDMEHGTNGWTRQVYLVDDLWHHTTRAYNSPLTSWWCGSDTSGTYATGNAISTAAVSPAIDLSRYVAPISLEFYESYSTEQGWDYCMVDVSTDGGVSWTPLRGTRGLAPSGSSGGWRLTALDLSPWAGTSIKLRFFFDTGDAVANDYPGWFFDDVLVSAAGVAWLTVAPMADTVAAGATHSLTATFDAASVPGGDYLADIQLLSNDPLRPLVAVPASLHVTGVPRIALSDSALAFGQLYIGQTRTDTLTISNVGSDQLDISSLSVSLPVFSISPTVPASFQIAPGATRSVPMMFAPTTAGVFAATLTIASNDPTRPSLAVPLTGTGLVPPQIVLSPDSLTAALYTGERSNQVLRVENHGGSDLTFGLQTRVHALSVPTYPGLPLDKGAVDPRPGIRGSGGPDLFGYTWRDSDEPGGPYFNWVDITGIGTLLPFGGDDATYPGVGIGFEFPFYGDTFSTVNVCTNGFLSFTSTSAQFGNQPLPSIYGPENLVAALWDDLYMPTPSAYVYQDSSEFIVSYVNVPRLGGSVPYTFQIILDRNGRIVYQYQTSPGPWDVSATVGIQNATRDDGLTVAFDSAYVHDGLAVEISGGSRFLSVVPSQGVVPAGGAMDLTATFDASGLLGGDYHADVDVASNDPVRPLVTVPGHLHVTGAPHAVPSRDSVDFGPVVVGTSRTDSLVVTNRGTDVLIVSSVGVVNPAFTAPAAGFSLAIGHSHAIPIQFAPPVEGAFRGSLVIHSNDPAHADLAVPLIGAGVSPPDIVVTPPAFQELLGPDDVVTRDMVLENRGGLPLDWSIEVAYVTGSNVAQHVAARSFTGTAVARTEVLTEPPAVPDAPRRVSVKSKSAAVPRAVVRVGAAAQDSTPLLPALDVVLARLNAGYTAVSGIIPSRFDFTEGETGRFIRDGGSNMYDGGNLLQTDIGGAALYSDKAITTSLTFPLYFTAKYPGLFVLAANITGNNSFMITGNLGADGNGAVDLAELEVTLYGTLYRGFVKRVYGAGTPSVNHLIIVPSPGETFHDYSDYTDDDYDQVSGLLGSTRVYYLLYAGTDGAYIDDAAALQIMRSFLMAVTPPPPPPPWLSVTPDSGQVAGHVGATLAVRFDSHGVPEGSYDALLFVRSNDPDQPQVNVPASMLVTGPTAVEVSLVSSTAAAGVAQLVWHVAQAGVHDATVYRRTSDTDWRALAAITADGDGNLRFDDHAVTGGQRYGYRLGVKDAGAVRFVGESWVNVPLDAVFALHGLQTNPAVKDVVVVFSLADSRAATLELLDVSGRRVAAQEVGGLGAGRHVVTLGADVHVSPGVYLVRLRQAGRALTARVAVIR